MIKKHLIHQEQSPWGKTTREQKLGLEFEKQEYDEIDIYCKELNIEWFASAWDIKSLEFLDNYNLKYHKIASAMIVDHKFLNEVAKKINILLFQLACQQKKILIMQLDIFKKNNCSLN